MRVVWFGVCSSVVKRVSTQNVGLVDRFSGL